MKSSPIDIRFIEAGGYGGKINTDYEGISNLLQVSLTAYDFNDITDITDISMNYFY